jgi:alanine-glyoxylate transaminase/serine-glyoxylate transaminase/serine-pyruvate transaminase
VIARPGLEANGIPTSWRYGVQPDLIEARLRADAAHHIRAVCVVHHETSTGVTSDIAAVRQAIDAAGHPALLLVDTISGLAAADYRHDEWGVDVSISGSQKGLMLPPGLGFNAVSPKALAASKQATFPKAFWGWHEMIEMNRTGYWPTATQAAVRAWGLAIQCAEPSVYSPILTGVMMPEGVDADEVRKLIYERYDCSLGTGLGKVKGRMFRIGHLGDCNDLTLIGAIAGCEMGLKAAGVALQGSGVQVAMDVVQRDPIPAVLI